MTLPVGVVLALIDRVRKAETDRDHARGVAYRLARVIPMSIDTDGDDLSVGLSWKKYPAAQPPTGAETDE